MVRTEEISKYVTLKMTDAPSKHVWKIKESCYVYTTLRDFFVRHRSLFIRHESAMCGSRKYPPHLLPRGATDILKGGGTQKETNSVVCNTGVLHYSFMRKIIFFFCDKMRKNLFIYVNTVSNELKDFLG